MQKYFSVLLAVILFFGCKGPIDDISLNYSEYQLDVNGVFTLTATTDLKGALEWYSTNPDVAKVFYGEVTGLAAGEADIVAKIGGASAVCLVIVEAIPPSTTQKKSAKRGISYNLSDQLDAAVLAPGVSWYYNWGNSISANVDGFYKDHNILFIPMFWSNVDEGAKNRVRTLKQRYPELEYILGFNEPNLKGQADITPAQAAPRWMELVDLAQELNMKLVSPAMAAGGTADPIVWLDQFFNLVPLSSCDAIAIHCYMPNSTALINFVNRFRKYNKPIWMTEFCAWEGFGGGAKGQIAYASEVLNFFEADPQIGKYAWFIPRYTSDNTFPNMQLLKQEGYGTLLPLGNVYVNASSLDKTSWAKVGERIEAEYFTSSSIEEYINNGYSGEMLNFHYQPTTDRNGNLEISNFLPNRWVEYQLDVVEGGEHELLVRYANYYDATFEITIDGANAFDAPFPKTGDFDIWKTAAFSVNLSAGKHTVRVHNTQGMGAFSINWLQFNKK